MGVIDNQNEIFDIVNSKDEVIGRATREELGPFGLHLTTVLGGQGYHQE